MTVSEPAPPPTPLEGGPRQIGPFAATARLGVGRRTATFLAASSTQAPVMLRVLGEGFDPDAFEAETRGARAFDTGVQYDLVRFGGGIAAHAPAIAGESLQTILERAIADHRPLDLEIAVAISVGIAARLAKAGEKKFHGDLVPHHVIVGYDGSVQLIDAACAAYRERMKAPDRAGYRSPEQVRGDPVGAPSDVFSLGILLFEMTTASRLFAMPALRESDAAILEGRLPRPRDLVGDGYPIELQLVLRKLLRPSLAGRFTDGASARDALRLVAAPRAEVTPDGLGAWLAKMFPERLAAWEDTLGKKLRKDAPPAPAPPPSAPSRARSIPPPVKTVAAPPRPIFIPPDHTEPALPHARAKIEVDDLQRPPFAPARDTAALDAALNELEADVAAMMDEPDTLEPPRHSRLEDIELLDVHPRKRALPPTEDLFAAAHTHESFPTPPPTLEIPGRASSTAPGAPSLRTYQNATPTPLVAVDHQPQEADALAPIDAIHPVGALSEELAPMPVSDFDVEPLEDSGVGDAPFRATDEPFSWGQAKSDDLWSAPESLPPTHLLPQETPAPVLEPFAHHDAAADLLLDESPRGSQDLIPTHLTRDLIEEQTADEGAPLEEAPLEEAPHTDRAQRPGRRRELEASPFDEEPVAPLEELGAGALDGNDTIDEARPEDVLPEGFLAQVLDATGDHPAATPTPSPSPAPSSALRTAPARDATPVEIFDDPITAESELAKALERAETPVEIVEPSRRDEAIAPPREPEPEAEPEAELEPEAEPEAQPEPEAEPEPTPFAALAEREATPVVPRTNQKSAERARKAHLFERGEAPTFVGAPRTNASAVAKAENVPLPRSDTAPMTRLPAIPADKTAPMAPKPKPAAARAPSPPAPAPSKPVAALWTEAPTLESDGEMVTPPPAVRNEGSGARSNVPQARVPTLVVRNRIVPVNGPSEPVVASAAVKEMIVAQEESTSGAMVIPIPDDELDRAARRRQMLARAGIAAAIIVALIAIYVLIMQFVVDAAPVPLQVQVIDPAPAPKPPVQPQPVATATVTPARTATQSAAPIEAPAPAPIEKSTVFVKVRPKYAKILVDGKPVKNESTIEIEGEPKKVVITAPGYADVVQTLQPGSDLELKILLKKKTAPR